MKKLLFLSLIPFILSSCSSPSSNNNNNTDKEDDDHNGSEIIDDPVDNESEPIDNPTIPDDKDDQEDEKQDDKEEQEELSSVFTEPYLGRQYYLNHIGDIYSVWNNYRGKGVTVAVIDKAFHAYHEDFYDKDGNLTISPLSASFNYSNNNVTTQVGIDKVNDLSDSHGTFCAGIVGARNNSKGVIGIAPESTLMLLKADGKPKSIAAAFKYAADNGARVITISIGSYYSYDGDLDSDGSDLATVFDSSLEYCHNKGIVVCSAAGNGGGTDNIYEYTFPGACKYVIGCGGLAANSNEQVWEGSSLNSSSQYQFVDVFAPADMMYGCSNYSNNGKYYTYDGGWKGTSFASPIVAGMAALYFEKYPTYTVTEFERDLYASCHKLKNSDIGTLDQLGYGRVDVSALLKETNIETVTLKVKSNMSSLNVYAWNSDLSKSKELASWPGRSMSKENGYYTYSLNLSEYDSVIFNNGSNQTVDISASSFINGNYYDISTLFKENSLIVGNYQ